MPKTNLTETQTSQDKRPPEGLSFWGLFDHFWAQGIGNAPHNDGTPTPWTATTLEIALDGSPDKRSIENWQSQSNMPGPDSIRKLSWVIAGNNKQLRLAWYEALIAARLSAQRQDKALAKSATDKHLSKAPVEPSAPASWVSRPRIWLAALGGLACAGLGWVLFGGDPEPTVQNMWICSAPYFDEATKDCTQHVSVFPHGIDEVFLSFDFVGVPEGTPFDRWWILNGERVAGRTSFNDDAWPGYTFWRPGTLELGQYVVRIVVDEEVFTQTFYVQPDGFQPDTE